MALLKKEYKGNSLMEVVIATVILSILVVIVFQVFNNLLLQAYYTKERDKIINKSKVEISSLLKSNELNLPCEKTENGYKITINAIENGKLILYSYSINDSLGRIVYHKKWYEKRYNAF